MWTVFWTYRTHKTGVMPGESKSLQKLIPCLNGEVTAVAVGPKHGVVVCKLVYWWCYPICFIISFLYNTLLRIDCFLLYLFHSMAVHPPCGTCCLWLAVGRLHRRNRTHARSVSGHSWLPVGKMEKKQKKQTLETSFDVNAELHCSNIWQCAFLK